MELGSDDEQLGSGDDEHLGSSDDEQRRRAAHLNEVKVATKRKLHLGWFGLAAVKTNSNDDGQLGSRSAGWWLVDENQPRQSWVLKKSLVHVGSQGLDDTSLHAILLPVHTPSTELGHLCI